VFVLLPGEARLATFPSATAAQEDARTREADARTKVNPFRCGSTWAERCNLPEPVFCDFLRDAGIEPPAEEDRDWALWWEQTAGTLTSLQRARVWEGLDRLRFFAVTERPARPVAYAVVQVQWNFNDNWYYPGSEGGAPTIAYRSREKAEAECARRNAYARAEWQRSLRLPDREDEAARRRLPGHELYPFDMEGRPFPGQDPFAAPAKPPARPEPPNDGSGKFGVDEVPFFEVAEFELEGPA
jgi:hypothetical protein